MSQGTLGIMGSRLEHVIARNLAELRAEKGLSAGLSWPHHFRTGYTQTDVAEAMRQVGFRWQSNRVAQIETLHRPVTLLEIVGLSRVFGVPVSRLLSGDDEIDLPSGIQVPLAAVRAALAGEPVSPEDWEVAERRNAARDELGKIAKRLDLDWKDLSMLSYAMWRRSFIAERESRLGDVSGLSMRSAQTKRGHVTRVLLADIADFLGEGQQRLAILDELHTTGGVTKGAKS
jgi:transcriptional regulator with XRE-family HTH domain